MSLYRAIATSAGSCGYASIKAREFIAGMYHNVRVSMNGPTRSSAHPRKAP